MISVLLPTFNGEKYLAELLESLLSQTYQDFVVYIRDDNSSDNSYTIITEFAENNFGKIKATRNEKNTGEARFNYFDMMMTHKDDYVMLCDQDDVWLSDKIEKSIGKMKELEGICGSSTPLLVYTDLMVVNEKLEVISSSYEKMANKYFYYNPLNIAVTMNNAAGCTILYNRALAELIRDLPEFFVMHDWWVYLIAVAFGYVGVIHRSTVMYRQHDNNESGAKRVLSLKYVRYVLTNLNKMTSMIRDSYRQSGAFLKMYEDLLDGEKAELFYSYASMTNLSRIEKLRTVFRYKTFMHGFARKVAQVFILVFKS